MVLVTRDAPQPLESAMLRDMFEARKRVFVDLLKWDVPVIGGRYEIDQFDDEHAAYLIVTDIEGAHLGSARLLKSERPHILDSLFPDLCAGPVPRGADMLEITRFCLGRNQNASARLGTRNKLVTALVSHALANGVTAFTGVAEISWLQQILAFGWRCRPLGLPRVNGASMLGALLIDITQDTPALLQRSGIWSPEALVETQVLEAA